MTSWPYRQLYNRQEFLREARRLLADVEGVLSLDAAREQLLANVRRVYAATFRGRPSPPAHELIRARDCALAFESVLCPRADARAGFSVAQALWDLAAGRARDDLTHAFYAELINWARGIEGRAVFQFAGKPKLTGELKGREGAIVRSYELDRLGQTVQRHMARYVSGLGAEAEDRREQRRQHVLRALGGTESDWRDWRWHTSHLIRTAEALSRVVALCDDERRRITRARHSRLPFAVTPYYASLMDDRPEGRDRALRAQVIPPADYIDHMAQHRDSRRRSCDFMLEADTSPVELITRRYPSIVILKAANTCPQICVYCQRNWEIDDAMDPGGIPSREALGAAIDWIAERPAVHEVLITGGDPLVLGDDVLRWLLERLAAVPAIDMIRIGTRMPITVPMRVTDELASLLGSFRELGRRDVAVLTHIEHPYELSAATARAVDRLRRQGIGVYNQLVFTYYVSRRFESAMLRMLLRRIGVDPYYTFAPKGKDETASYRVPLARILQEQKEEARLMPGLRRTDEAVFNIPGLGKNYLRAVQHRDLITLLPDGSRVVEFHPWEKNLAGSETYLATDVPILHYLVRLAEDGEDPHDYDSIWFYF